MHHRRRRDVVVGDVVVGDEEYRFFNGHIRILRKNSP